MRGQQPRQLARIKRIGLVSLLLVLVSIGISACGALPELPEVDVPEIPGLPGAQVEATATVVEATVEPTVVPTPLPVPTPIPGANSISPSDMVDILRGADAPFFELFDWSIALGLIDADTARTRGTTPRWAVDDVETFNLPDGAGEIEAELQLVTPELLVWLDVEDDDVADRDLQSVADAFADSLGDVIRDIAGGERSPGMDGSTRIHLVYAHGMQAGTRARFDVASEYPTELEPLSAEREVIYFNLDEIEPGDAQNMADVAREFWRMIQFNVDRNEEAWAAEGQVLLSQVAAGVEEGQHPALAEYLADANARLNQPLSAAGDLSLTNQGASYLYFLYLYERLGKDVLADVVQSPLNGLGAVDSEAQGAGADALFHDWAVANLIDDGEVDDGQYGYDLISPIRPCPISPATEVPFVVETEAVPYSIAYYELQGGTRATIDFVGAPSSPLLSVNAFDENAFWWSGSAEGSAASITRRVDLTDFGTSALNYAVWFDIDADAGDAAYILTSTDEGETWQPLSGLQSKEIDGLVGYTGTSGGGEQAAWVQERIDLSPLGGQEFLLRFVYVTDNSAGAGIALDNISITEVGLFDGAEALDPGWEVEGWLRTSNQVENRWGLFLVTEAVAQGTDDVSHLVQRIDVNATGEAELDHRLPAETTSSWVVVALAAPGTDFASPYSLSLGGDYVPTVRPQLPEGGLVIEDFNATCGQFKQAETAQFADSIVGGRLNTEVKLAGIQHLSVVDGSFGDVSINVETSVIRAAPGATNGFGVVCRYSDDANYYGFELRADARARIFSVVDGVVSDISPQVSSGAIDFGAGALNNVTASCVGDSLSLTVNGEVVGNAEDSSHVEGQIGLLATTAAASGQAPAVVTFDNFFATTSILEALPGIVTETEEGAPQPTATPAGTCDCSGNLYDCRDFSGRPEAQACYNFCGGINNDVHLLDADLNGVVCETVFP